MPHYEIDKNLTIKKKIVEINKKKKKNDNLLLAKYGNIGYYLVTPLIVGVFLGLAIDSFLRTKPLFTVVLLVGGVVGTFYNLIKLTKGN